MTSVGQVLKSVGPKLVPFFKTVAIYYVVYKPNEPPSIFAAIIKCLPVVSLIIFVLLHGMSLGQEHSYSRKIITGLFFCCLGDAFLLWPSYFELGMLSFAIGHVNYISAFGFKPLNLPLGIALYAINFLGVSYLWKGLNGVLTPGVTIYSIILTTMVWRAIARARVYEDLWTWSKLCTCAGGILFAVSDFLIGIERFLYPIEHSLLIIMATYFGAQVGIALSVVDEKLAQCASMMEKSAQAIKITHTASTKEASCLVKKRD